VLRPRHLGSVLVEAVQAVDALLPDVSGVETCACSEITCSVSGGGQVGDGELDDGISSVADYGCNLLDHQLVVGERGHWAARCGLGNSAGCDKLTGAKCVDITVSLELLI